MTLFICLARFLVYGPLVYDACRKHESSTRKQSGHPNEATPSYYFPAEMMFSCLLWHLFAGDFGEQDLVRSAENDQYAEEE
jgi:hypothetical protein